MKKLQSAKIYLFLAAMLFVAKPFLGFGMFSKLHPPAEESIFVKAFSKSADYSDENCINLFEFQKKAFTPQLPLFSGILFLLSILFPVVFGAGIKISEHYIGRLKFTAFQPRDSWLLNGNLLI